ncbi:MAG: CPBP family intramembrane glutamic endopeptidase [Chloroflexota bacterium]
MRLPPSLATPTGTRPWLIAGGPAILLAAALAPGLRPVAAGLLLGGWLLLRAARRPEAIAWAAVLPVGLVLPWPWLLGADVPLGDPACTDPLSSIVLRRLAVAGFGLAVITGLARVHASGPRELGLGRPAGLQAAAALGGAIVLAGGGLVIGPWLARPFFGELEFPRPAAALVPAILFGLANGVLEEVSYRGAMQAWLGRAMPIAWAIAIQGLAFGSVHAGPEVLALLPVHIALMGAVGIAGGLVRARLGSLWLPIGVHVGADIALYVGLACRAAA